MLTDFPHREQNSAPSASFAPHPLQPNVAVVISNSLLAEADRSGSPHFGQNCEPSGRSTPHLLHKTAGTWRSRKDSAS
jgi:hypothetical protein